MTCCWVQQPFHGVESFLHVISLVLESLVDRFLQLVDPYCEGLQIGGDRVSGLPSLRPQLTPMSSSAYQLTLDRQHHRRAACAALNAAIRSCVFMTCTGSSICEPSSRIGISLSNSGPECDPVNSILTG